MPRPPCSPGQAAPIPPGQAPLSRFLPACLAAALAACQPAAGARERQITAHTLHAPSPIAGLPATEGNPGALLREGGFSDLVRDTTDPTGRTFWTVNDRGPNLAASQGRLYPFPDYHQKIARIRIDGDTLRMLGAASIADARGRPTVGLPSLLTGAREGAWGPTPDRRLAPDSAGFDFEGLATDGRGGFWLSDEYGPRLVRARPVKDGFWRIEAEYAPGRGLPIVLSRRQANQGLEALARLPDGRIAALTQRPLANAAAPTDREEVAKLTLARRLILFRPAAADQPDSVQELVLLTDLLDGRRKPSQSKIGACTALRDGRILILEHGKVRKGGWRADLWILDAAGATDVHRPADPDSLGRTHEGLTIEELALSPDGLARAGIRPVLRIPAALDFLRGTPFQGGAKPEGLALVDDSTAAVLFDNDYGLDDAPGVRTGGAPIEAKPATTLLLVPIRIQPKPIEEHGLPPP